MNKQKLLLILNNIKRLTVAGISNRDIAEDMILFGDSYQKEIAKSILNFLDSGDSMMSTGLKKYVPEDVYNAIAAGEYSGNLTAGLNNAIQSIDTESSSGLGLLWILSKGLGVFLLVLGIAITVGSYLIPMMKGRLINVNIHAPIADSFTMFSEFSLSFLLPALLIIIAYSVISIAILPYVTGSIRKKLDKLPIWNQYRLIKSMSFLYALSNSLRQNGIKEALLFQRRNANPYMKEHINKMLFNIESAAETAADIISTGLLDDSSQRIISLIIKGGNDSESFLISAKLHQDKISDYTNFVKFYVNNAIKFLGYAILLFSLFAMGSIIFSLLSNMGI